MNIINIIIKKYIYRALFQDKFKIFKLINYFYIILILF